MSRENLKRFSESLKLEPELQAALAAVPAEDAVERAVELARARHMDFTAEELRAELGRVSRLDGELGERELEAVAGGFSLAAPTRSAAASSTPVRDIIMIAILIG
jgi:predicted ribosomally synthesized peptide with nif11-like leader